MRCLIGKRTWDCNRKKREKKKKERFLNCLFRGNVPVYLAGHSFGGYLAGKFALKYGSDHVNHLMLLDPWGLAGFLIGLF
jgi:pimeloyl-ACP methyl ester carboxylesterase